MLRLTWTETGLRDLQWWVQHDPKMLKRILGLCLETCKNPRQGIGKPPAKASSPPIDLFQWLFSLI